MSVFLSASLVFQELTNLENELLAKTIPTQDVQVDPAPFQLVEETSLYKAHSLFALLGLSHSFVTKNGKLVGVVTLEDVRHYRQAFSNPVCVCACVRASVRVCACVYLTSHSRSDRNLSCWVTLLNYRFNKSNTDIIINDHC